MKPIKLTIQIEALDDSNIHCFIENASGDNRLGYHIPDGTITLTKANQLAAVIRTNRHQFEKVIRSAIKGNIKVGQTINCVFIEGFNFLKEPDFFRCIRLDRRGGHLDITTTDSGSSTIHKIYADGSCISATKQSGYGGFIEDPEGKQEMFFQTFAEGSSNLMELLAVTEGLQRLKPVEIIQVNTDSRFVIRGLAQWSHFWKHNNWQTAYGREVRYAKYWKEAYRLCENKLLEFNWIKGHSGNGKHDLCHWLAKESSSR